MNKRITIEELQSYLWNSAVLLRTNIDAGAYKQYIFPLLFFKRICDVYDEECQQILEEYGDEEYAKYTLTLTDIIEGLQRAANGTYKTNNDTKFIRQCFNEFADEDCCDFDLTDADALMQIITFNELIYG